MEKQLKKLCETDGISGFEKNAANVALEMLKPYVDEASVDAFGNVVGYKYSKNKEAKTILLDAHIDQIGFIVTQITEEGFLRFSSVGGVDPRMLLATDVFVLGSKTLKGVICSMPPHLSTGGNKSVPVSDMLIDVGYSKEQVEKLVRVGTPIIYGDEMTQLSKSTYTGKSLDDRAGVVAILHTLELLKDKDVDMNIVVVFSGSEEIGGVGSKVSTFRIKPDMAIAIDVTFAKSPDTPQIDVTFGKITISKGPNMQKQLTEDLIRVAKAYDIPHTIEIAAGPTGTNARHIQVVRGGVPVALLGIPLKYMHTQIETISLKDLKSSGKLMAKFIETGGISC